MARPKPGRTLCAFRRGMEGLPLPGLVDLVEDPAVGEVGPLGLLPASEDVVDGDEFYPREGVRVLLGHRLEARPVEMPGRDLLPLGCVEVLEVGLGHRPGALLVDD